MEVKKNLPTDILDIIFDQRNKEYGAYELRKNYTHRAKRALFGMLLFAFVAVSIPLLAGIIGGKALRVAPPIISDTVIFKQIEEQKQEQKKQRAESAKPNVKTDTKKIIDVVKAKDLPKEKEPINKPFDDPSLFDKPDGDLASNAPTGKEGGSENGTVPTPKITIDNDPDITYNPEMGLEEYPEYPGGEDALIAYLASKIKYPSLALSNNIEGKVVLGFVINKNGEIDELKVLRSLGYGCDEEAMRVVRSMPLWKPGKNNKKPVRVYFNLPIAFQIAQ